MLKKRLLELINLYDENKISDKEYLGEDRIEIVQLKAFVETDNFKKLADDVEVSFGVFVATSGSERVPITNEYLDGDDLSARIFREWNMGYKNTQTFYAQEDVFNLDLKELIILDDYAFAVSELKDYAENSLQDFYKNPHNNAAFSAQAKAQLHEHVVLKTFAQQLDQKLLEQVNAIDGEFLDKVQALLNGYLVIGRRHAKYFFTERDLTDCDTAKMKFLEYYDQLPLNRRQQIDDYIIRVPLSAGGTQNMRFDAALVGGGEGCIIIEQTYLWQFIKEHRPDTVIPAEILHHSQNNVQAMPNAIMTDDFINVVDLLLQIGVSADLLLLTPVEVLQALIDNGIESEAEIASFPAIETDELVETTEQAESLEEVQPQKPATWKTEEPDSAKPPLSFMWQKKPDDEDDGPGNSAAVPTSDYYKHIRVVR